MSRKRRAVRVSLWTIVIGVLSLLGYGVQQTGRTGGLLTNDRTTPGYYRVLKAVDGDTLEVNIAGQKESVRLIGVDTPETHDPRKPVQCFGHAAAEYTKGIAEGREVRLEADPQDSDRDKYHRLLRYVYFADGRLLNAEIIQNGYGFVYTIFPYSKLEEFRGYERDARANNRGLWAGCTIDESTQIKQTSGNK